MIVSSRFIVLNCRQVNNSSAVKSEVVKMQFFLQSGDLLFPRVIGHVLFCAGLWLGEGEHEADFLLLFWIWRARPLLC